MSLYFCVPPSLRLSFSPSLPLPTLLLFTRQLSTTFCLPLPLFFFFAFAVSVSPVSGIISKHNTSCYCRESLRLRPLPHPHPPSAARYGSLRKQLASGKAHADAPLASAKDVSGADIERFTPKRAGVHRRQGLEFPLLHRRCCNLSGC
ncbi:hypothetical protein FN846DRAFT_892767 [Sphaerosporella brunnea]|uniref:Transmembrane protein n=1 Tax=Sphaerosporella brunnea TaxID=1250544 RepID=A0A5J5EMW1_9PEZI|nr:hypothetical protein FN846DRAFT_892767 [Sphaerosporella brunnea]